MKVNKSLFEQFISKYNLSGTIEQVEWVASGNGLYTRGTPESRAVIAFVTARKIEIDPGTYNVYNTNQLKSLLGCLGDEFELTVKLHQNQPKEFVLKDSGSKVTFSLADPQAMPLKPSPVNLPPPDVQMTLDGKFYKAFAKAKSAIGTGTFGIKSDGQTCEIILSDFSNNSVTFTLDTTKNAVLKQVHFSADSMYDILSVNKENEKGVLEVTGKGIAHITYQSDEFLSEYYLLQDMTKLT
jgi:hypothetical protein